MKPTSWAPPYLSPRISGYEHDVWNFTDRIQLSFVSKKCMTVFAFNFARPPRVASMLKGFSEIYNAVEEELSFFVEGFVFVCYDYVDR